ncbi:hypothetical protein pkur_cds_687 [Pandoravirus kuranda]|uniref:Ankyrin repeat domain containing protein n=1 Tax=Pandoravirus kuranda TaxID=3019033 RepID=A0AA95ENJ9_9VIRU|nr:hypothetical protein pkur_cds_687 [Pandoravirus kuranda]
MGDGPRHTVDEMLCDSERGLLSLPPELIAAVLAHVGDRDFCRCLQASTLFWPSSADTTVETRKRRWRGCVNAPDFCATGNTEALALLMERGAPFDEGQCVVNAIVHGHADRVLDILRRGGVIDNVAETRNKWLQDVCYEAARLDRVDILVSEWRPHMLTGTIFDGAIKGDSLAAFQWACEKRGSVPTIHDIADVVVAGATSILRHYRRTLLDERVSWPLIACMAASRSVDIDVVFLCMGDAPSLASQEEICARLCGRATVRDIDLFYVRFPDAFGDACLLAAAWSKNLDVARWLCQRFPDWNDRFVEQLVRADPINAMFRSTPDLAAEAKWFYDVGLVADVPKLAHVAARCGKVDILLHVIRATSPTLAAGAKAYDQDDMQQRHPETGAASARIRAAAVAGALARFLDTGDPMMHDSLVEWGVTAPCLGRIRMASFRAHASFSRTHT